MKRKLEFTGKKTKKFRPAYQNVAYEIFKDLHIAIQNDNFDRVKELFKEIQRFNFDPSATYYSGKETVLHIAARMGRVKIIQYFLDEKVNPRTSNNNGNSPLFEAIRSNQFDAFVMLLTHPNGVSHRTMGSRRKTPLHFAIFGNNHQIVNYLLTFAKNDAEFLDQQDEYGDTALHIAIQTKDIEIIKSILELHPDLSIKNYKGFTAKEIALNTNHFSIINLFDDDQKRYAEQFLSTFQNYQVENRGTPNSLEDEINYLRIENQRLHRIIDNLVLEKDLLAKKVVEKENSLQNTSQTMLTDILAKSFAQVLFSGQQNPLQVQDKIHHMDSLNLNKAL